MAGDFSSVDFNSSDFFTGDTPGVGLGGGVGVTGGGASGAGYRRVDQFPELIRALKKRIRKLRRKEDRREALEALAEAQEADGALVEASLQAALEARRQREMLAELARLKAELEDEEDAIFLLTMIH